MFNSIDDRIVRQIEKAEEATIQGDVNAALFIWKKLDQEGFEHAAYHIGVIYEHGGGDVTRDYEKAIKWYEKSIKVINDEFSIFGIANIYFKTREVSDNAVKSYEWFYKLINSNQPGAFYALDFLYENGVGIHKDRKMALKLYRKSAQYGHLLGLREYGLLLLKGGHVFKGL